MFEGNEVAKCGEDEVASKCHCREREGDPVQTDRR
jgi:hypothetical protein